MRGILSKCASRPETIVNRRSPRHRAAQKRAKESRAARRDSPRRCSKRNGTDLKGFVIVKSLTDRSVNLADQLAENFRSLDRTLLLTILSSRSFSPSLFFFLSFFPLFFSDISLHKNVLTAIILNEAFTRVINAIHSAG